MILMLERFFGKSKKPTSPEVKMLEKAVVSQKEQVQKIDEVGRDIEERHVVAVERAQVQVEKVTPPVPEGKKEAAAEYEKLKSEGFEGKGKGSE